MKKKKDDAVEPLNEDVLGDLSIEELEERLELQILHPPETQDCYDCGSHVDCETFTEKPKEEISPGGD